MIHIVFDDPENGNTEYYEWHGDTFMGCTVQALLLNVQLHSCTISRCLISCDQDQKVK